MSAEIVVEHAHLVIVVVVEVVYTQEVVTAKVVV
jgi:hypothetical protein